MAFIMRAYKKNLKLGFIFILLGFFFLPVNYTKNKWVHVKSMYWHKDTKKNDLFAELDFRLSPTAHEALRSGIVLYWDVSVLVSMTHFVAFFSEPIYSRSDRYSLHYNTLFNDYRVRNEKDMSLRRFSSLFAAIDYLALIKYESVILSSVKESGCVVADLNILFDREALPIPLRPIAYFDRNWDLSTYVRLGCE
jgi:hypothetical protein